ncbi:MAG: hypothetical protein ACLGG7_02550 [Bacteriovoracia bacterium]
MQSLTSVERIVLESIGQSEKSLKELQRDTNLEVRFLTNILQALTLRGFVALRDGGYGINRHLPVEEFKKINDQHAHRQEALELIEGLASGTGKNLGLRKAWVSEKDRSILKALLKNVEDFMASLPPAPKGASLNDYTVVVWGEDKYGDVIKRLIGSIA